MSNYTGWYTTHRKIWSPESDFYNQQERRYVFLYLLSQAWYFDAQEACKFGDQEIYIKRGQCITGLKKISQAVSQTISKVRSNLNALKAANRIAIETANNGTLITIINYDTYQRPPDKNANDLASTSTSTLASTLANVTQSTSQTKRNYITNKQANKKTSKQVNKKSRVAETDPRLLQVADKWANHVFDITERDEVFSRVDDFAKGVKSIMSISKLDIEQVDKMLDWIKQDDFWTDKCLSPQQMVKKKDGKRKIDSVLAAMKRNYSNSSSIAKWVASDKEYNLPF